MPGKPKLKNERKADPEQGNHHLVQEHQVELVATSSLTPDPRNSRTHSRKQVAQIAESIKHFGFINPVLVDEDGMLIAGHGRLEAAKLLGLKKIPTICVAHLSEAERRAYILADNKIAQNAG